VRIHATFLADRHDDPVGMEIACAERNGLVHPMNFFSEEGTMKDWMTRLWRDESGQDLAEYALLVALIALVVIGAVTLLGTQIQTVFNNIANALNP
jgi:pilus assembly protein Flp/PilA